MTGLNRQAGLHFITQPYRETLTMKSSALLRKEIRFLSEQYGEYIRLFKRKNEYEAVFSKEQGYLLGEMVWHYFHHLDEMIYCEQVNEHESLLIIVREGKIYLDALLSQKLLQEELTNLFIETKGRYTVYLAGEIPEALFSHPAVKSLIKHTEMVSTVIAADQRFQLLDVENALDEYGLELHLKKHFSLAVVAVVLLSVIGTLWWWFSRTEKTAPVQVNPYQQYKLALNTPNPSEQINSLIKKIEQVNTIQGWYAGAVSFNGEIAQMPLHSMGGTATDLMMRSQSLHMQVTFSSKGASVHFPVMDLKPRGTPDHISNANQVVAAIIDRMMRVLPGKSVQVMSTQSNAVFSQTSLTISFKNISAPILELVGKNLNDLPVVLTSFTATISNGLYSGNIQVNVVGN